MPRKKVMDRVEERHRTYVEAFCKQTRQRLIDIVSPGEFCEEVHYVFSKCRQEGTYTIRGIFKTLEGL